jgi:hypothetical protein
MRNANERRGGAGWGCSCRRAKLHQPARGLAGGGLDAAPPGPDTTGNAGESRSRSCRRADGTHADKISKLMTVDLLGVDRYMT